MLNSSCPLLPRTDFVHYALLCRSTGMCPSVAHYGRWLPAQMARRRHSERELERQIWVEPPPMADRLRRLVEATGPSLGYSALDRWAERGCVLSTARAGKVWAWLRAEGYIS